MRDFIHITKLYILFEIYYIKLQIAATFTMSSTEQPRDKSQ